MRAAWLLPLLLLAPAAAAQDDPRARLVAAKAAADAANTRAVRLERAAAGAADSARRAAAAEAALNARIQATQADIAAAEARVTLIRRLAQQQRRRLAAGQGPLVQLIAALQSLAARPSVAAIVQPGSVDDLIHVRAALGTALPVIRARTAAARAELDRTRALERGARTAAGTLRDGRARLEEQRLALVRLEVDQRLRGAALGRDAGVESERALALGERARDIVGALGVAQDAAAVEARLVTLAGPLPRPGDAAGAGSARPYRLPVAGRIVTGLGEISDAGVRARGLTLAAAPGARVAAPAAGRIRYAGAFRDYGRVVVIDHGAGWTSALLGLGALDVRTGDRVTRGEALGRAPFPPAGDDPPRITVELRRQGRPVDVTPLIGGSG